MEVKHPSDHRNTTIIGELNGGLPTRKGAIREHTIEQILNLIKPGTRRAFLVTVCGWHHHFRTKIQRRQIEASFEFYHVLRNRSFGKRGEGRVQIQQRPGRADAGSIAHESFKKVDRPIGPCVRRNPPHPLKRAGFAGTEGP
ncbi:MAG: hypothetical protein BWY82_00842 [Verrucomicrobia bacterium ADurb.Bin474]|nr:MAG: hypothetical protein BWY82_00842 [Verrucomicrobia bacterium ADurb.Bin474]